MKVCEYSKCNNETPNPRFCSKSCSARESNKTPKRKRTNVCKREGCSVFIVASRTYCSNECYISSPHTNYVDWTKETLGDCKRKRAYQHHSRIRTLSRKVYLKSDKPQCCVVCGYDKHFDVAHIKGINEHSDTALISEINSLDNLIALCKNHHWEYDAGMLSAVSLSS